jgi:hypothetical protein
MEDNMKRLGIILFTGLILACGAMQPTYAQTIRGEAANHPRIAAAIRELEGPIAYMERAPHGFGGHKAAAIRDSRTALVELRAALAYRAQKDGRGVSRRLAPGRFDREQMILDQASCVSS